MTLTNTVYPLLDQLDEFYLPYTFDIPIFEHSDNPQLKEHIQQVGKIVYTAKRRRRVCFNPRLRLDHNPAVPAGAKSVPMDPTLSSLPVSTA